MIASTARPCALAVAFLLPVFGTLATLPAQAQTATNVVVSVTRLQVSADRRSGHLTTGAWISHVTWGGLRIEPWRSLEVGELAGSSDLDGGRWGDWPSDDFAQPPDDGSAWTDPQEMTDHDLVLVGSFLSTAGESAAPGDRWLDWEPAALKQFAFEHESTGDGPVGRLGSDCERSRLLARVAPSYGVGEVGLSADHRFGLGDPLTGVHPSAGLVPTERFSVGGTLGYPIDELTQTVCNGDGGESPLRLRRTASGMPLSTPLLSGGAATRIEVRTALHFGTYRPRNLGKASFPRRHAYPSNPIEWNGHSRVALSVPCFAGEGRGPC